MSYLTWFYLSATRAAVDVTEAVLPALIAKTGMAARYFDGEEAAKWYEHDEDMQAVSRRFPDVVFRLHGVGQGSADVWVTWYLDGQRQGWDLECAMPDAPPMPWGEAA